MEDSKKGFNIGRIARDKDKSRDGAWIDCAGGLRIKVACLNDCAPYKEHLMRKGKNVRRSIDRGAPADVEQLTKLQREAIAHHVLKDWNLTRDEGGKEVPIPYSPKAAIEAFETAPELLDIVVEEAGNAENFRISTSEDLEADAKN